MVDVVANLVRVQVLNMNSSKSPAPGKYKEFDEILSVGEDAIPTLIENIDWAPWTVMSAICYITNNEVGIPQEFRGKLKEMVKIYKSWYKETYCNGARTSNSKY